MTAIVAGGYYAALNPFTQGAFGDFALTPLTAGGFATGWFNGGYVQGYTLDDAGNGGYLSTLGDHSFTDTTILADLSLAALPDGGFVGAWFDSDNGIVTRMFDSSANPLGPSQSIAAANVAGLYGQLSVAAVGSAGFVVAHTVANDGNGTGIHAQFYDASGNPVGGEFGVNSQINGDQSQPVALSLPTGGFLISWADAANHSYEGQFYDSNGHPVGGQETLATGSGEPFDAAVLASGNVVMVSAGADGELHGQIYTSGGATIGSAFQVNGATAGTELLPSVTALESGGFAVAWGSPADNGDIHAQEFGSDGAKVGDEIVVAGTGDAETAPHIVSFGSDDLAVSYFDVDASGNQFVEMRVLYSAVQGTDGPDVLTGTPLPDYFYGNGGDDQLSGLAGNDELHGGAGNDTLYGGDGNDTLDGGAGNDVLNTGDGAGPWLPSDLAWGGSGADQITGGSGNDYLYSDQREDPDQGYLEFNPNFPQYYHAPTLDHGTEVDTISAGGGDDFVSIGYGDSADGGDQAGNGDTLFVSFAVAPTGVVADFRNTTLNIGGGTITGFENVDYVEGSQFNDTFTFSSQPYPISGFIGASGGGKEISGLGGDDLITGGYYTENVWGGDGNDFLDGRASQYLMYISGGAGDDTLLGSARSGAVLDGGDGDDIIIAGGSFDRLTGGSGNDIFEGTAAALNSDRITDFSAGDKIVITDANAASFTFNLSANTLTYTGGSLTLSTPPSGHMVASAAPGGGVQLSIPTHTVHNDLSGDGRADILWRNDNGAIFDFLGTANGGVVNNGDNIYTVVDPSWHFAGTGDFNGDGRGDILWSNDAGQVFDFLGTANGGVANNGDNSWMQPPSGWSVAGVADLNGDGRADMLLRSSDGTITDYLANAQGGFADNSSNLFTTVGNDWHVVGTGDFNGDGIDDILWRNDNGAIFDFLGTANGGVVNNGDNIYTVVDNSWHVAGVGDFNGDGRSDILWGNAAGQIFDFLGTANGGVQNNGDNSWMQLPSGWTVAGTGDMNGDGRTDILLRSSDGTITDYLANTSGGFSDNSANLFTTVDASWHVQDNGIH